MTSGPTQPTLKGLFAKSSNRCAFPKCTVNLVQGDTLLGRVCHIKGSKPGSARYDPSQDDADRHSDGNLIILCPNHHAVIDDDDETYTVERLLRMKAQHEARASALDDATAIAAIKILARNSVSSSGQVGGITSGTMTVGTLNYSNAPANSLALEKETQAIEKLWAIIGKMREVHGDIWLAESILKPDEIDKYFQTHNWPSSIRTVTHYSSFDWEMEQLKRAGANDSDECRLYVSDQL